MTGNPMVSFNRAIATAMVDGPAAGLALLEPLAEPLAAITRLHAVRAPAIADYRTTASRTTSLPEQHDLLTRAARLAAGRDAHFTGR